MSKVKRTCLLCDKKPAKAIKSNYQHAFREPAFCSVRCAADYGLIQVTFSQDMWCEKCGSWVIDYCVHSLQEQEDE